MPLPGNFRPRMMQREGGNCEPVARGASRTMLAHKGRNHRPSPLLLSEHPSSLYEPRTLPIPGASQVLSYLNDNNIPFILLTNGGGKREEARVSDLKHKLGVHLSTDNFVQSHTPFRELLDGPNGLRDKTILVTGSDPARAREIFQGYGFRKVVTPWDIYAAHPDIFPFPTVASSPGTEAPNTQPLPAPVYSSSTAISPNSDLADHLKIDAMFVANDPREWALDIQLITDLLLSHQGYLGTLSPKNNDPSLPNRGWQQDGQPPLYFSNGDLVWSAGYHLPRFGQGAFQAALRGVWARVTSGGGSGGAGGHELQCTVIGKPHGGTYRFSERVLAEHRRATCKAMGHHHHDEGKIRPLKTVYMVGDNPESDIAGANDYVSEVGTEWVSVLVKTGVYSSERAGRLEGRFEPKVVVDDVSAALRWALEREGWTKK
ncbi:Cat eye syndrome critical region protein 5 [Madurella mycetomatis]|uniref:Cat eye syndrome critical region protein 5 n=1 Tax=Madurella mycetomatis TaxID=100816 RepID=A0A175VTC9_9PEZI|nr:Cat eye syndrome critical region protein 5 [Madurella mycetomatis]